jgi:hypothetical protein
VGGGRSIDVLANGGRLFQLFAFVVAKRACLLLTHFSALPPPHREEKREIVATHPPNPSISQPSRLVRIHYKWTRIMIRELQQQHLPQQCVRP